MTGLVTKVSIVVVTMVTFVTKATNIPMFGMVTRSTSRLVVSITCRCTASARMPSALVRTCVLRCVVV
jgi:hypothetical protein